MTTIPCLRYLVLDVRCPECRQRPKLRVPVEALALVADLPSEAVLLTYQCHIRRQGTPCGEVYPITVGALQRAS
jgi:hypothetical protein